MPAIGEREMQDWLRFLTGKEPDRVKILKWYLETEYQAGRPVRLTIWRPDAVGQQLSDKIVNRLEIASAIRLLRVVEPRQALLIELLYDDGLSTAEIERRLRISGRVFYRERHEALIFMANLIFDWVSEPSPN